VNGAYSTNPAVIVTYITNLPMPADPVGAAIITAAKAGVLTVALIAGAPAVKAAAVAAAVNVALAAGAGVISAGDLLSSVNQTKADGIIVNALTVVNAQITSLGGSTSIITQALDDMTSLMVVETAAAGDYLNTNYEKAASAFKASLLELQGAIFIMNQGFDIPESVLEIFVD